MQGLSGVCGCSAVPPCELSSGTFQGPCILPSPAGYGTYCAAEGDSYDVTPITDGQVFSATMQCRIKSTQGPRAHDLPDHALLL